MIVGIGEPNSLASKYTVDCVRAVLFHFYFPELDSVRKGLEEESRRKILVVGLAIAVVLKDGNEGADISGKPIMSECPRDTVKAGKIYNGHDNENESGEDSFLPPLPMSLRNQ